MFIPTGKGIRSMRLDVTMSCKGFVNGHNCSPAVNTELFLASSMEIV